jgi:hypothetical protein
MPKISQRIDKQATKRPRRAIMTKCITIYLSDEQYSLVHKKQISLSDEEYGKKSISSIARAILLRNLKTEDDV